MFRKATPKPGLQPTDYEKLGKAVESALITDYIQMLHSTKKQIWSSFVRGVFYGLGTLLGATVGVAVIIYILAQLGNVPGLHHVADNIRATIQQSKSTVK
jgi:hypothetical protein